VKITWEEIEQLRDETFFRTRKQQIHTVGEAETFINTVGFCFAFKANRSELPCLWHAAAGERNPEYPLHVQNDPYISLVWVAKDQLAAEKKVYYGKAFKKRPTFISLEYFPHFYRLISDQRGDHYLADYTRGGLSRDARRILDILNEQSPQITADLKTAAAMSNPDKRSAFDAAMAELQSKLYVVKIGEFYDPFTFLWDLVERRFADEISASTSLGVDQAREAILLRYFKALWVAGPKSIERLFAWSPVDVGSTLDRLVEKNLLTDQIQIDGEKALFFGLSEMR
jgi:hypothetical protein